MDKLINGHYSIDANLIPFATLSAVVGPKEYMRIGPDGKLILFDNAACREAMSATNYNQQFFPQGIIALLEAAGIPDFNMNMVDDNEKN